jgi:hypothetical protein
MDRTLVPVALIAVLSSSLAIANEATLVSALKESSGANALACGTVKLGEDATAAVECARTALAAKKPFWFAAQIQGTDSSLWRGVALEPGKNNVWVVSYDSDVHGGGGTGKESLQYGLCPWVKFSSSSPEHIQCTP